MNEMIMYPHFITNNDWRNKNKNKTKMCACVKQQLQNQIESIVFRFDDDYTTRVRGR